MYFILKNNIKNGIFPMLDFKSTLCLYETTMPIRVNTALLDQEIYTFWETEHINDQIFSQAQNKERYVLHDGPPYANGAIHLGHAYNKIMKDICIRSRFMMGYDAHTAPGWDCNGLPIEHKVLTEYQNLDIAEIKKNCRTYANHWVEHQKESFKKLGVIMDWNHPYKTMDSTYQAGIIESFGKLFSQEYISRSNKTIPWCCGCKTALANAEIEYKDRKDPSIYVLFELHENKKLKAECQNKDIYFVIWTTTPWTLPLNRGIMLKKKNIYLLLAYENILLLVGKNCLAHFQQTTKKAYEIIKEINAEDFQGTYALHPFEENTTVPVLLEDVVEGHEGTACVHTAPGCGPIDYEIGIKNGLEIYSPISPDGKYTTEVQVKELVGLSIPQGQSWVINQLIEKGKLLFKTTINHSYPHCWRSLEGLIFRATPQWFCNLEKNNFKEKVIDAINKINFYPISGQSTLNATVLNRWEWCISRQRVWGVPIIALINTKTNTYWTNYKFIHYIAEKIKIEGIEYWDTVDLSSEEIKKYLPLNIDLSEWRKEKDILDVWFDSGVSHTNVLKKNNDFPANVYLEGIDQHRGWFQSSLLTAIALYGEAPMKAIVSCGYTVDEKGQKMSKSLGNGVAPEEVIKKIGLDGLRIWVAGVNLGGDIVVSNKVFENVQEIYRKIRNTCRFAVQNIVDFDPQTDMILVEKMDFFNQYIIKKLYEYNIKIISFYQQFEYAQVCHTLIDLCNSFLSSLYFDISKDILYCEEKNSFKRRSIQSTLYIILETITKLSAPILVNTMEDITNHYKSNKKISIHKEEFARFECLDFLQDKAYNLPLTAINETIIAEKLTLLKQKNGSETNVFWTILLKFRDDVFKKIEEAREKGLIKQSIESKITIYTNKDNLYNTLFTQLQSYTIHYREFFNTFLLVSDIEIHNTEGQSAIEVIKHTGTKCARCWKYFYTTNNLICERCEKAIEKKYTITVI